MHKLLFIFMIVFSLHAFSANYCSFDSNCRANEVCVENMCKGDGGWSGGQCRFSSDCPENYTCINNYCEAGGSWPSGGCNFSSDCPDGYSCNYSDHSCLKD